MKPRIVVRRRADADSDKIADYIAVRNIDAGRRFLLALKRDYNFLAENPNAGAIRAPRRRSLRGLRCWPIGDFENYLIFYIPKRSRVEIVRVLHGARDTRRIFGEH